MKLAIFLTFLFLAKVTFSQDAVKCSKAIESQVHEGGKLISCMTYQQKDKEFYAAVLEHVTVEEDLTTARIRHYQLDKSTSRYKISFSLEDMGEYFLPLTVNDKSAFMAILDINDDGRKDVVFRTYRPPSSAVFVHTFKDEDKKITSLGMIDTGFEAAEFFPFIIADYGDQVLPSPKKILILSPNDRKMEYVWKKKAFILKK
ncbi:MAG: hypothetical protein NXH75_14580 [Halobacteriovoraceae bacterium]|nr:hypothetical protein [Halobacteriovoraceae bacterium]